MRSYPEPAKHNIRASTLCIRSSLKQAHQKGCWWTGAPTSSRLSRQTQASFPSENRWDRWRAASHLGQLGPFLLEFWERKRFRLLPRCCRHHHWGGAASPFRCKLVLLARDSKGDIATKLPTALANDEAWPRLYSTSSLLLHDGHDTRAIVQGVFWNRKWKTGTGPQLRRLDALVLTNSSIIPQNADRASSTCKNYWPLLGTTLGQRAVHLFESTCLFFPWNPSKPTRALTLNNDLKRNAKKKTKKGQGNPVRNVGTKKTCVLVLRES